MTKSKEKPVDILARYMGPLADMRNRVHSGICPFCKEAVRASDFRDDISFREFEISGLCQKCQDETFDSN